MPSVAIAGGGLAGLAAAAVLGEAGFQVDLFESRPYPGGRAASYPISGSDSTVVDNCQHILLRCCTHLLDFYRRLGVSGQLTFHREFYWVEPGGRTSVFRAGPKFELLAENASEEYTLSTIAVAKGQLFLRTEKYLYAIGK